MKARKSRKIAQKDFERLYYKENATIEEICKYFGVAVSSIGAFRARHGYKPRIHTHQFRKYPQRFVCEYCGDSFPNKHGHPQKFCSHKCSSAFKKGKQPPGGFPKGKEHWNYTGKRIKRTYNYLVFNYADMKEIAIKCNYACSMCGMEFEPLPIYKIRKSVSFDHIVPIAMGGEHSINNGQMLCRPCTKVKNSTDYRDIISKHKSSSNPSSC